MNIPLTMAVPDYTAADFSQETWWLTLIKAVFIIVYLIVGVIMALWVERRGLGRMQTRPGPNVAGPLGLLQAVADAVKLLFKEDIRSTDRSDNFLYWLGPTLAAFCAFSTMAVIPMGPNVSMFGHSTPLQLADMPVATLYILAITSLGLYGIVLGGWSARSTLPLYGAVRSSAQVISYELSMGLALVSVFLMTGSMSTSQIVASQGRFWYFILIPAFVIYCISAVGEINRLPFDLPEAEGELVAGHMTEYTGMKFGWYYLSEYINMLNVSAVATTMFLGGWHAPWPFSHIAPLNDGWWGILWFLLKVWFFMFLIIWTRGTLIRIRYDQFMSFGWKRLIPIALGWVVAVAVLRGATSFLSLSLPQLLGAIVAIFVVVMAVMWIADAREMRREAAAEKAAEEQAAVPFDPMAGGFPVPPLPGQTLPPSPRAGRAPIAATVSEGPSATREEEDPE